MDEVEEVEVEDDAAVEVEDDAAVEVAEPEIVEEEVEVEVVPDADENDLPPPGPTEDPTGRTGPVPRA